MDDIFDMFDQMFRSLFGKPDNVIRKSFVIVKDPYGRVYLSTDGDGDFKFSKRDVMYDVMFDEKTKEKVVTIELPGVEKSDIKVRADPPYIYVKVDTERLQVNKKIFVGNDILFDKATSTYKNGILEIRIPVDENKGFDIPVK